MISAHELRRHDSRTRQALRLGWNHRRHRERFENSRCLLQCKGHGTNLLVTSSTDIFGWAFTIASGIPHFMNSGSSSAHSFSNRFHRCSTPRTFRFFRFFSLRLVHRCTARLMGHSILTPTKDPLLKWSCFRIIESRRVRSGFVFGVPSNSRTCVHILAANSIRFSISSHAISSNAILLLNELR